MKAWRFHAFGDMRLDDVPEPICAPGHVLVEPICVQPSVTEAQLAQGISTLAYDRVKRRLETEAPVQLFGHEFCARIIETGPGVKRFHVGDRVAVAAPGYPAYRNILATLGIEVVEIETVGAGHLTAGHLAAAHAEKPLKGVLFASPANPTGAIIPAADLEELVATARQLGIAAIGGEGPVAAQRVERLAGRGGGQRQPGALEEFAAVQAGIDHARAPIGPMAPSSGRQERTASPSIPAASAGSEAVKAPRPVSSETARRVPR